MSSSAERKSSRLTYVDGSTSLKTSDCENDSTFLLFQRTSADALLLLVRPSTSSTSSPDQSRNSIIKELPRQPGRTSYAAIAAMSLTVPWSDIESKLSLNSTTPLVLNAVPNTTSAPSKRLVVRSASSSSLLLELRTASLIVTVTTSSPLHRTTDDASLL